jgi:hypothetical protein
MTDRDYDALEAVEASDNYWQRRVESCHDVIRGLLKFRWKSLHYDKLACLSCGAAASIDYDTGKISRVDTCSPSCPWRRAEEVLAGD